MHKNVFKYLSYAVRGKILKWEKIGKFGQYFTRQLFLLVILLATEVMKQLPFNLLNVSYSAYYSTSLLAILLAHTADTERFTRSFAKVMPITRIDFYTTNLGISKANNCRSWLTNHRRFNFTTRNMQTIIHASLRVFGMVTPNFRTPQRYL